MDLGLENGVALVAGSSRGIGLAVARAFLGEGSRVVLTGRDGPNLQRARAECAAVHGEDRVLAWQGDVSAPGSGTEALGVTLDRWGRLDCLVMNAGSGRGKTGWDLEPGDWQQLFEQNLWSATRFVHEVLPHLVARHRGSILFMASIAGLEALGAPIPYSAAKAALVSYAGNLARALAPHGLRVNSLAPGNILFPGGSWEEHLRRDPDLTNATIQREVPMGRFGNPEEIAALAVFLCSDRASFVTGACIKADGGQTRGV
jgi:3-oxoacyl-[acyl-carrier protein] reductase